MKPTEKQLNLLKSLFEDNYITEKQYKYAVQEIGFASKIINQGLKFKKNRQISREVYEMTKPRLTLKEVQERMRVQNVHVSYYNGRRISRFTKER